MGLPTQLFVLVSLACLLSHAAVAWPASYWERDNDAVAFERDPVADVRQGSRFVPPHIAPSYGEIPVDRDAYSRSSRRAPFRNFFPHIKASVGRYGKRDETSPLNEDAGADDIAEALPELPHENRPYDIRDQDGDWYAGGADQRPLSLQLKRARSHLRTHSSRYGRRKRAVQ